MPGGRVTRDESKYCDHCARYLDRPPTARELEMFLAVVECGTTQKASRALRRSFHTVRHAMQHLYLCIGAKHDAHAVWLLWPLLKDRYRLPGDKWDGRERRMAA